MEGRDHLLQPPVDIDGILTIVEPFRRQAGRFHTRFSGPERVRFFPVVQEAVVVKDTFIMALCQIEQLGFFRIGTGIGQLFQGNGDADLGRAACRNVG